MVFVKVNWISKIRKLLLPMIGLLTVLCIVAYVNPFKVTDPSSPRFDPENFQFEDYHGVERMSDALRKLFPLGTDKKFVENVLVGAGGAVKKTRFSPDGGIIYSKNPAHLLPSFPDRVWSVTVKYDQSDKVLSLRLNGSEIKALSQKGN